MKKHIPRLLPVLACLAVLAAALLPPQVSRLRDQSLSGAVHAEELDNSLPSRSAGVPERITLLCQMYDHGDSIVTATQPLDEQELLGQTALTALKALAADSVIPMTAVPDVMPGLSGFQYTCRDRLTGVSAVFWELYGGDGAGFSLDLVLEEGTGTVCTLDLAAGNAAHTLGLSEQMAQQYYDSLELEAELVWSDQASSRYRLAGTDGFFQVFRLDGSVGAWSIRLEPDGLWSLSGGTDNGETAFDAG